MRTSRKIKMQRRRKHRGATLVEAMISMLIVSIVIGAVLASVASSTQVLAYAREDLGAYTLAANWFEMLEAQPSDLLVSDFEEALKRAAEAVDPNSDGRGGTYGIRGYVATAVREQPADGSLSVTVSVSAADGMLQNPLRLTKTINTISNATVSNDYTIAQGAAR